MTVRILFLGLILSTAVAFAQDRIFFSRTFPGSAPEYFEVTVDESGAAQYREAPDEEPLEFTVDEAAKQELFDAAGRLDRFSKDIASKRKVAFTGDKVLRYEPAEGAPSEARFSYTEDETARQLVDWFHRASETERLLIELERVERFDRLGVNDALLALQSSYDRGRVVAPEQFLPILQKIVEQDRILHLARSRAAGLIERIEAAE